MADTKDNLIAAVPSPAALKDAARRKRLIDAVRACAERDGAVPGVRRFAQEVGEKRHLWSGVLWPSWRAFLLEAGLTPGVMTQPVDEDELLTCLAELTREHGRFPSTAQIRFAHAKNPAFPGEKTFRNRFGGFSQVVDRLRAWVTADRGTPTFKRFSLRRFPTA